jgi:hypothetical protein
MKQRVIQYEREIGREPSLQDLLGRFTSAQIDIIYDSLEWLYPGIFSTVASKTTVPELVMVA